jgi:hypothetical protein
MAKPRVPKKVSDDISVTSSVETASSEVLATESKGTGSATNGGVTTAVRKKVAAKPEIVKSEPRATIVPINLEDEIRRLAYLLAERRGFAPGHESDDWLTAEREVHQRYHQHSA